MAGEPAVVAGREIRLTWPRRRVPVYFASSGPRSLRLAGRIADGVLFQVGSEQSFVEYALAHIAAGAAEVGRAEPVRYVRLACVLDEDRERAREEIKPYASVAAGTVFATVRREHVPADVWHDLRAMKERYDYYEHASRAASHKDLLTERVIDAVAVAGTPDEAIPRFRELIALGVDGFVIPITASDPRAQIRTLADSLLAELA